MLLLCVGRGWSSIFSAMSVSPCHYLGWVTFNHLPYLKNTASLVTAEHLLCTPTNSLGDFVPLRRKVHSDIFYLALECFIQQKMADFFFFFCYFFSGHDLLAPIGVLGPEDSKVHKILTEMQRKGD